MANCEFEIGILMDEFGLRLEQFDRVEQAGVHDDPEHEVLLDLDEPGPLVE